MDDLKDTVEEREREIIERITQELQANFEQAFMLTGRGINRNVPCYLGSYAHIRQIIQIFKRNPL